MSFTFVVDTLGYYYNVQTSFVSISGDGSKSFIGGFTYSNTGASWLFNRNANNNCWSSGQILIGSGSDGTSTPYQGYSVAISRDGDTVIVGGYQDSDSTGAAWIFVNNAITTTPTMSPASLITNSPTTHSSSSSILASSNRMLFIDLFVVGLNLLDFLKLN